MVRMEHKYKVVDIAIYLIDKVRMSGVDKEPADIAQKFGREMKFCSTDMEEFHMAISLVNNPDYDYDEPLRKAALRNTPKEYKEKIDKIINEAISEMLVS